MSIYEERFQRIMAAIHLEKIDRTPLVTCSTSSNAAFTGLSLAKYCADMEANCTANLEATKMLGNVVDGIEVALYDPDLLPTLWATEIKIPGRELTDNELWQLHEKELVTQDDYDNILEYGYGQWYSNFIVEKLDNPFAKSQKFFNYMPTAIKRFHDEGYPLICAGYFASPFELFCGGRSLQAFLMDDLMEIPEKVDAIFKLAHEFNMQNIEAQIKDPATRPIGAWIGGWRGTPSMLSSEIFQKFSFKYIRELTDLLLSYNVLPIFHLDSCWDLGLEKFLEMPKGKCLMSLDGKTNIFKAKEILGNHMCIKGDVPAELLAFGTSEKVKAYCDKLVKEMGTTGFIMASGCDTPFNAKFENVNIMAQSVLNGVH